MKKIFFVFALIITLTSAFAADTYAQNPTCVYCDDKILSFEEGPYIIDGFTFVPVRGLGDALGFTYSWDDANKTVVITSTGVSAWIQANNYAITVNKGGFMYSERIDAAPRIIDSRIFIPLRVIAELFDSTVSWDDATSSVIINTPDKAASLDISNSEASISISDFVPPASVTQGSSYILSGMVSSDLSLDRLNIKITDVNSGAVEINETAFNIGAATYSLSDIDSRITFGKLAPGAKVFQITCVDEKEQRCEFTYDFVVTQPQGATIDGDVSMLWPVPSASVITTIFWCDNAQCHSNAGRANGHAAIDISADEGTPVIAVCDGVVELQGEGNYENGKTGYGNFVLLDHGEGLQTQYSHLYEIFVTDGQVVKAGDIIGSVGNTGNSTGNHLDFYISQDGVRCDPLYYIDIPADVHCREECDARFFEAALAKRGIVR